MPSKYNKQTVKDVPVEGRRVFVRVDFNVPLTPAGEVADRTRLTAAAPTIKYLAEHGAKVILASHFGRPKGKVVESMRLAPVAKVLPEVLGGAGGGAGGSAAAGKSGGHDGGHGRGHDHPVTYVRDCVGPEVEAAAAALKPGEILLLDNLRFYPGEEANDPAFAKQLAALADLYVNDAFGAAHRAHASTTGMASFLPAVAGFLMEQEVRSLGKLLEAPARPFVAILGGAKVSDKIGVIENLLGLVDRLLIGGGMANTFLAAQGHDLKKSLVEQDKLDEARRLLAAARGRLQLPVDVVAAAEAKAGAQTKVVPPDGVPDGWTALDVGPRTADAFAQAVAGAGTVFWNGPLGLFEIEPFDRGSTAVAKAIASSKAFSVVGGGDSIAALEKSGVAGSISHISTGGGASLEFLEGRELPGVACLADRGGAAQ